MRIILTKHASYLRDALQIAINLPDYFTKVAIKDMTGDFRKNNLIIAEDGAVGGFLNSSNI